ncbi:MAG: hypothetical protein LBC74_07885 [Planctomycetaceae bacterium]|jgi:hypothetical protein|nr:hypothetical protein [Planctomycetaceae bacterium]
MKTIKYTSLFFLLVIFTFFLIGCQTFAPDYNTVTASANGVGAERERERVSFFESAKRLFMPDFDNENVEADLKVAGRNTEHLKQSPSKNTQNYAYGNSLSTKPQQAAVYANQPLLPQFYPYPINNINTNFVPQQNNFVTKNTPPIKQDTNQIQKNNKSSNISDQIVQSKNIEEKNNDISPNLVSSNISDLKVESSSEPDMKLNEKPDLKSNKKKPIKKYAVDPLSPQHGDSDNFRLFLKELAEIPADKLKVDETELIERIEAFRVENAVAKSSTFERVAIDILREDILPDFLTDKKLPNKKNYDSATKSVLTSNKSDNSNSSRKPDIEQVSYSGKRNNNYNDLYCNDNSNTNNNAPLPVDVQPSDGKKQRLSPLQYRGIESGNYRNSATTSSLSSATTQSMPLLPQLTNSCSASTPYSNLSNENRFDQRTHDNKFVSNSPNQSSNIITANYSAPNQNYYPHNNQLQLSDQAGNWEMQVRHAIMLLRREMEMSSTARTFSNEAKLRLLELSVGNRGEAIKPFWTAERPVNEFWTDQILGLSTIMDEVVTPNRITRYDSALLRFDSGVAALRQICPLRLRNVQLIQHEDAAHYSSFGNFQTRTEDCKPSEMIFIYLELENPTIKNSSKGYSVRVAVVCEILDTASNVVQKNDKGIVEDFSNVQKRDHFIKMALELKKNLPHGYYKLRIRVTDLNSHDAQKSAEEQIPIRIIQ